MIKRSTLWLLIMMNYLKGIKALELLCENRHCYLEYVHALSSVQEFNFSTKTVYFKSANILTIYNSRIQSIPDSLITSMPDLEKIIAEHCGIESVTFDEEKQEFLKNLKYLHLSHNQIQSLLNGSFAGASQLRTLELTGNRLSDIAGFAFQGLTKLEVLVLSSNSLKTFDWSVLTTTTALNTLRLDGNRFEIITSVVPLPSLTLLNLGGNQLTDVAEISKLGGLTELFLSSNENLIVNVTSFFEGLVKMQILHMGLVNFSKEKFDFNKFYRLPELRFISLDYNSLQTLDGYENIKQKFPKLEKIDIGHNSFPCTYLGSLLEKLKSYNITAFQIGPHFDAKKIDGIKCIDSTDKDVTEDSWDAQSDYSNDYDDDNFNHRMIKVLKNIKEQKKDINTLETSANKTYREIFDVQNSLESTVNSQSTILVWFAIVLGILMIFYIGTTIVSFRFCKAFSSKKYSDGSVHLLLEQGEN